MTETGQIDIEEFRKRIDKFKVTCQECGHKAHSLASHLQEAHSMSSGQYKKKYAEKGILVSPIVSELLRTMPRKAKKTDRLETFLEAFEGSGSSEVLIDSVKKMLKPSDSSLAELVPSPIPNFHFDEPLVRGLAFGLLKGKNVYIEGPTGCGKTELSLQLHAVAGLAVKRVNMNGDVTTSNFIGKREIDPAKGTYYDYGNLPKAMKGGYTLLIDEIDYMPPQIAAVLNSVLEGKRSLYLPEVDETIVAKEGFNVVATANTGGKGDMTGVYSGTEIMNTALLDRFSIKLTASYLPQKVEAKMLESRFSGEDVSLIEKMTKSAEEVRKSFSNGVLPFTISTRKLIDFFEMKPALGHKMALDLSIMNWLDDDNRQVVEQILNRCGVGK